MDFVATRNDSAARPVAKCVHHPERCATSISVDLEF